MTNDFTISFGCGGGGGGGGRGRGRGGGRTDVDADMEVAGSGVVAEGVVIIEGGAVGTEELGVGSAAEEVAR